MKVGVDEVDVVEAGTMEFSNNAGDQVLRFHRRVQQKFAEEKIRRKIQKEKEEKKKRSDVA